MTPQSQYGRVRITKMGAKGHRFDIARRRHDRRGKKTATFVDVAVLAYALTGVPMSLASAGKRFNIPDPKDETPQTYGEISEPHVDYCRDDVRATMQLYETLMLEQYKHDIDLPEHVTYSPASLAKGYFDKLELRRPLEKITDIPQKVLGYAMTAFFGGRSEVMIRRTPVPAVLCDFTSMYPTVNALMKLWDLLRADDITAKPDTEAVRRLLTRVTLDSVLDPGIWPEFVGIAKVRLNGDVVPIRSDYGAGNTTIGLNYAYDDERWYAIPDLVASTLLTGKVPDVVEAYRFYPAGNLDRLATDYVSRRALRSPRRSVRLHGREAQRAEDCAQQSMRDVSTERRLRVRGGQPNSAVENACQLRQLRRFRRDEPRNLRQAGATRRAWYERHAVECQGQPAGKGR